MTEEKKSRIPEFANYQEEAEFWDTHDFGDYRDETERVDVEFSPNLSESLSIRLSADVLTQLRSQAERMGIGPSALVRMWIMERLGEDRTRRIS